MGKVACCEGEHLMLQGITLINQEMQLVIKTAVCIALASALKSLSCTSLLHRLPVAGLQRLT
jgi:hypothetical protein